MNTTLRLLRPFLAAFLLLLAVFFPVRAENWQGVFIDVAPGRAGHVFGVGPDFFVGSGFNFLVEDSASGYRATRIEASLDLDAPVVLFDFTASQTLGLGSINGDPLDARNAPWIGDDSLCSQYFILPWSLEEHQFALVHPDGTTYPVTKGGGVDIASKWTPTNGWTTAPGVGFEAWALCTPGQEFWLRDLNANARSPSWETYLLTTPWTVIPPQVASGPVLAPVKVCFEAVEDGHLFTVHSVDAAGVEFTASVAASYDAGTGISSARFAVGAGMDFWITRDADGLSSIDGGASLNADAHYANSVESDETLVFSFCGRFVFPSTAQRATEPQTFRIHAQRWGHAFTVWQSDGFHFRYGAALAGLIPCAIQAYSTDTIADWNNQGLYNPLNILTFTTDIDPTRAWWLRDDTTGQTFPVAQTDVLDGWVPLHAEPPLQEPTITLRLPYLRSYHHFQLFAPESAPGAGETALGQPFFGYGTFTTDTGTGLDDMVNYTMWTIHCAVPNPAPFIPGPFVLRDMDAGGEPAQVLGGDNDLRHWFGPAQEALHLSISTSRWEHELLIRHPDGTAYPVIKYHTQGNVSFDASGNAWQNSYYYFDATAGYRQELPWYIEDASTGERLGPNGSNANFIGWIALADPRNLTAVVQPDGTFALAWSFAENSTEGAFKIERRTFDDPTWRLTETLPAATSLTPANHTGHAAGLSFASEKAVDVRMYYQYGDHRSAVSNVVTLYTHDTDSDGDGLPDWWERLWNLNPNDARDGNSWNPNTGTTAGDLYGQGATPGPGGPPARGDWTKRLSLWQIRETAGNILTWDGEIKPQTFVTIEREQAYGQWVTVRTVPASDRYALAADSEQEDPLYHQHAQTGEGRSYQDAPNFRLRGGYPSNESVPRIRLMLRAGSVWRGQPGIQEFEGPWFWSAGTTPARKYYKHAEWWGSSSANDGSSWSSKSGHFTYVHSSNFESLTTDDFNTGTEQQSSIGDSYPKPYPTGHAGSNYVTYTPDTFDQNVSRTSLWRRWYYRAGVPSYALWGFGPSVPAASLGLPGVASPVSPLKCYESVTGTGPDESSWEWTLQLSEEYTAGEFNAASKALLPSAPDAEGTVIYQGAGRDAPQVTASYEQWPPLVEGSREDVFGQDGGVWYLGIAGKSGAVTSQRYWSESLNNLGLSRSDWWLECNDCLPGAPVTLIEYEQGYADDAYTPVGDKTPVRIISLIPGSNPGFATKSEVATSDITAASDNRKRYLQALPMEIAPAVLRVNANFDEQKIDPATGYALPDAKDESLKAAKGPNQGKIVVEDLHSGFFGIHPGSMDVSFFDGATITIAKKAVHDPESGHLETGKVRFHAVQNMGQANEQEWVIPSRQEDADNATDLVPLLYNANPVIPRTSDTQYWIEGVAAGKITLELHITKGSIDFEYDQSFLVATHQGKAAWQAEIRQQILLQTGGVVTGSTVDMDRYIVPRGTAPFMTNKRFVQAVYGYYQQLYTQNPNVFLWPGLARMAGGPVYAALVDAEYGRSIPPPWLTDATIIADQAASFLQNTLMQGNRDIFNDLAWQFRAYQASGIWALRYVAENHADGLGSAPKFDIKPWEKIWRGEYTNTQSFIEKGNNDIVTREQQYIVQPAWNKFQNSSIPFLPSILGVLAMSPLPGRARFSYVVGMSGNITAYPDRLKWINNTGGIWPQWIAASPATRAGWVGTPLWTTSSWFSLFSPSHSIIW